VNAGFLDVLHDRADHGGFAIGDAIDIDFDRVFEKPIDQHRSLRTNRNRAPHITAQIVRLINQLHRATAENE
jgi:hypothetical protein